MGKSWDQRQYLWYANKILRGDDNGMLHLGLLGLWTLSISSVFWTDHNISTTSSISNLGWKDGKPPIQIESDRKLFLVAAQLLKATDAIF
jgi:hypothetical protein